MVGHDDAIYLSPAVGFERLAPTYDARLAGDPTLLLETTATLSALPRLDGQSVADLACGTGRYAIQMARMGAKSVVAVDCCESMLDIVGRKARKGDVEIETLAGDISREHGIPAENERFDTIVCALALTFAPSLFDAFAEFARLLSPGGSLVISERHPHGLRSEKAAAARQFQRAKVPFLRFTDAEGNDCRIARNAWLVSDYIHAAHAAGLTLDQIAEPVADSRLAATYGNLNDRIGVPLALILRFRKSGES